MRIDIVLLVLIIVLIGFGFLVNDNYNLHNEIGTYQSQITALTAERDQLKQQISELDKQLAELQNQNTGLQDQVAVRDQQIAGLQQNIRELTAQLDTLKSENNALQTQLNSLAAQQGLQQLLFPATGTPVGPVAVGSLLPATLLGLSYLIRKIVPRSFGKRPAPGPAGSIVVRLSREEVEQLARQRRK